MSKLTLLEYGPYDCSGKKKGELLSSNRFRISILIVATLHSLFISFVSHRCISSQVLIFLFFLYGSTYFKLYYHAVATLCSMSTERLCRNTNLQSEGRGQRQSEEQGQRQSEGRGQRQSKQTFLGTGSWAVGMQVQEYELKMGEERGCRNPVKFGAPGSPVFERYYIQRWIIKQVRIIITLFVQLFFFF